MSKRRGKRGDDKKTRCDCCGQVLRPLGRAPGSNRPTRGCPICPIKAYQEGEIKDDEESKCDDSEGPEV